MTRETFDPNLSDSLDFFHPEDREEIRGAVMRGLETGEGFRIRARLIRADGEERSVEAHADTERGPDGRVASMFGVFQDVTDQERAIRKVTESERRYRLLASRVTDVIVTYGVDGLVTYVSPSVEAVSGHPPEWLIGRPATSLIHPDDVPALILGGMGVALETVTDGAQAVEAARSGVYDLILMDVHMPVMDGLDATRAIRGLEGAAGRVPIIALTANVQPDQVQRCREAGMDDHVGKPIQVAQLLAVISARLEQRAAAAAAA